MKAIVLNIIILYLFWMYVCQSLDLEDTVFANNLVHVKAPKDIEHCVKPFLHYSSQLKALHFSFPGSLDPSLVWLGLAGKNWLKKQKLMLTIAKYIKAAFLQIWLHFQSTITFNQFMGERTSPVRLWTKFYLHKKILLE